MRPARFFLIAVLIVVCDQVSKWAVFRQMTWYESRPVVPHVLWLTLVRNTGGAFSLFPAWNGAFVVVAGVATVALLFAYFRYHRDDLIVSGALALALGGAIGNLIDRARYSYVIDFFDVHIWPVFNVADAAITGGIVLLAWHIFWGALHPRRPAEPASAPASDAVGSQEQPSQ